MNILLRVDQQAALRRGINAPSSTITLDVTPDELTQQERDVLAAVMVAGHDCTRLGVQTEPDEIVGQAYLDYGEGSYEARQGRRYELYCNGMPTTPLALVRPDIEGLRVAIADLLARRDIVRAERLADVAESRKNMAVRVAREIGKKPQEDMMVTVRRLDGMIIACEYTSLATATATATAPAPTLPSVPNAYIGGVLVRPDYSPYSAQIEGIKQTREKIRAALFAEASAKLVKIEEQQQLERAEYQALYAKLPQNLRARDGDKFASANEIESAIQRLILLEEGLPANSLSWDNTCLTRVLSDDQYARLLELRASHPTATVEALQVCDEEDEGDEGDEGDEEDEGDASHYAVARLTICRGGVTATAYVEL